MTAAEGKNASQGSFGYLRNLLADGIRPFLFRERVCSLLGGEGGWSGPAKGASSHRPVGLPCYGARRGAPRGPGPGRGERFLPGDVETGRGGDSPDIHGRSASGGNGGIHGPAALRQSGEADGRRPIADGRPRATGDCAIGAGTGRPAGREGKDGERQISNPPTLSRGHESFHFTDSGAGEDNGAKVAADAGKESGLLWQGAAVGFRAVADGDGRGAKGESSCPGGGEKGRAAERPVSRFDSAGQVDRLDAIVIPGGTRGRGAAHPVATGAPEGQGAAGRSLEEATREDVGGGHGDGFAFSPMPERVAPGMGAAQPARPARGEMCEALAPEPEERISAASGGGFHAARKGERRSRPAKMPGGRRDMFAAMEEDASFMEESSLPRGDERNMAGALRTLEDHLRQKIEQLRETSARRPENIAARFAPDTANAREAGEAPPVLPARERIVIVGRAPRRSAAPAAFWERSYLGRLFLRPLR